MGALEQLFKRLRFSGRSTETDSRNRRGPAEDLREQHEQLVLHLKQVHSSVEAGALEIRRGRRGHIRRRADAKAIAELEDRLSEHFRLEESGGYLADALRVAPRYHARAEVLRAQHDDLSAEMRGICELAGVSGRSLEAWSELEWRLGAFARRLREHERAENEITSDAFLEDIGTSD